MRIAVTGAAGFVGSHCLRALQSRGHQPIGLVRNRIGPERFGDLTEVAELIEVDLSDATAVNGAIREVAPDVVINAAWYADPQFYLHDIDRNITSLQAGLTVLQAALDAGVGRVVLVGTCLEGVYNGPESIYARTKRCLHDLALTPAVQERTVVTCAHVFSPYGPGEHPDRVIPTIIRSLLRGEPIAVGKGTSRRDYLHISDVATALSVLAESSIGGAVDICTGRSRPLQEIFNAIATELGRPDLLQWGQAEIGSGEAFDVEGDVSALQALGWTPEFALEDGIRDAVSWWRSRLVMTRGIR